MKIQVTNAFKKDLKKINKRKLSLEKLDKFVELVCAREKLPSQYKSHRLIRNYKNYFEAHLEPDWLIIYKIVDNYLILARTGTHSDLFNT